MSLERSWGNEINTAIAIATVKDEILSQGDPGHKTFSVGIREGFKREEELTLIHQIVLKVRKNKIPPSIMLNFDQKALKGKYSQSNKGYERLFPIEA